MRGRERERGREKKETGREGGERDKGREGEEYGDILCTTPIVLLMLLMLLMLLVLLILLALLILLKGGREENTEVHCV